MDFLRSQGYENIKDFANGYSKTSFIGWSGNGSGTTEELLAEAYLWKNPIDFIEKAIVAKIGNKMGKPQEVEFLEVPAQHPFGKCFAVNTQNVVIENGIDLKLAFIFKLKYDTMVSFFVTDWHRKTWRRDLLSYSGKQIELNLKPSGPNYVKIYQLEVSETVDSTDDSEANCMEYSAQKYATCDRGEVYKYFMENLKCVPPWFGTNDNASLCQQKFGPNQNTGALNALHFLEKVTVQVTTLPPPNVLGENNK